MDKYKSIPNKVNTGNLPPTFPIDFGTSFAAGATHVSGCTLIYIVSRKSLNVGHYNQYVGGTCPLDTLAGTNKLIIEEWLENHLTIIESPNRVPLECDDVWVFIAGSSDPSGPGVRRLLEWFEQWHFIPKENIRYALYPYGSGNADQERFLTNPQGTSMVEWTSTDDRSGTIGVYFSSTSPRLWIEFRKDNYGTVQTAVSWGQVSRRRP